MTDRGRVLAARARSARRVRRTPTPLVSLLLALLIGACSPASSPGPASSTAGAGGMATPAQSSAAGSLAPASSGASPDAAAPLTIDPALLAFLPEQVAGVPITEDVDEAAAALGNPVLPDLATGLDAAVGVDAANGNVVYALVVRLRPGVMGEGAFRQWRDSYDEGACTSGGSTVAGHASAKIAGRDVYIGTCASGLRTYHGRIDSANVLVSSWSLGEARLGEALMAGIRVPA